MPVPVWQEIDMAAVVAAVGEEEARSSGSPWGGSGPVLAPRLEDGGVWAVLPGGKNWRPVYARMEGAELEVSCGCRQRARYCSHATELVVYAAENMGMLKEARAKEDEGIREAAASAEPWQKKELAVAAAWKKRTDRDLLHLLEIPPRGLPPRGVDYGRVLDMAYIEKAVDGYLEGLDFVHFDVAEEAAARFASAGDADEAVRICLIAAETVVKNTNMTDDSYAHYYESLRSALDNLASYSAGLSAGYRRRTISRLARRVALGELDYFAEDFVSALDSVCVSEADREWCRSVQARTVPVRRLMPD